MVYFRQKILTCYTFHLIIFMPRHPNFFFLFLNYFLLSLSILVKNHVTGCTVILLKYQFVDNQHPQSLLSIINFSIINFVLTIINAGLLGKVLL